MWKFMRKKTLTYYGLCKQGYVENASELIAASELEYIGSLCGQDGLTGNTGNACNWWSWALTLLLTESLLRNNGICFLLCVAPEYMTLNSLGLIGSQLSLIPVLLTLDSTPQTHFATPTQDIGIYSKSMPVLVYDGCFNAFTITQNLSQILHVQSPWCCV